MAQVILVNARLSEVKTTQKAHEWSIVWRSLKRVCPPSLSLIHLRPILEIKVQKSQYIFHQFFVTISDSNFWFLKPASMMMSVWCGAAIFLKIARTSLWNALLLLLLLTKAPFCFCFESEWCLMGNLSIPGACVPFPQINLFSAIREKDFCFRL